MWQTECADVRICEIAGAARRDFAKNDFYRTRSNIIRPILTCSFLRTTSSLTLKLWVINGGLVADVRQRRRSVVAESRAKPSRSFLRITSLCRPLGPNSAWSGPCRDWGKSSRLRQLCRGTSERDADLISQTRNMTRKPDYIQGAPIKINF